jgi:hypothetical protein
MRKMITFFNDEKLVISAELAFEVWLEEWH